MDAKQVAAAEGCLQAAYAGAMSFPDIVQTLAGAGFESYLVDYRRNTTTYFLPDGASLLLGNPAAAGTVAPRFDGQSIADQVRWAQANGPDYSYGAFCTNVRALGCAGYLVSFSGRRVLYFGRTAETHVEHFPQ